MRILTISTLILVAALICVSQTKEPPKQDIVIPGTRVSLLPPAGFTPSTQFTGFWQESLCSSIMVTEFPVPFLEISAGFADTSALAKRGMSLVNRQEVNLNKQSGVLLHVKQVAGGLDYIKWVLIFGDEGESVLIVATFPKELENDLSEKMKASLLTAKWDREKRVAPTETLNFTIAEKGDIKFAKRIASSSLYTKSGVFPSKSVDDPIFIIARAFSSIKIADREDFVKSRIVQTANIIDIEIEQLSQITVDDLKGYEIIAKGMDTESKQLMAVYQAVLFEDQAYYIMQGLVSSKVKPIYLPAFQEMARSLKREK